MLYLVDTFYLVNLCFAERFYNECVLSIINYFLCFLKTINFLLMQRKLFIDFINVNYPCIHSTRLYYCVEKQSGPHCSPLKDLLTRLALGWNLGTKNFGRVLTTLIRMAPCAYTVCTNNVVYASTCLPSGSLEYWYC